MKKIIALTLITFSTLICSLHVSALENGALYQWVGKDGTPTYSPEPPPDGIDYTVVGADLKPLAIQPEKTTVAATVPTRVPVDLTPKNEAPKPPKWKPVRYAQDPSLKGIRKKKSAAQSLSQEAANELTIAANSPSDKCIYLKRDKLVLESAFSKASTDAQMDQAILKLKETTEQYKRECQ